MPNEPADDQAAYEARVRAAEAMRRLGHAMVGYEVDLDLLDRIAREATATAERLESQPRRERDVLSLKSSMWSTAPPDGGSIDHFEECVVSGPANPMGIRMRVRREGEQMVGAVNFGHAFEGAPQRAHGGAVAAVLDDIMGYVLSLLETPAYTGTLTVTYDAPAPVDTPLEARAWLDRRDGRKLWIAGTLSVLGGDVIARCDGLFITIPADRFRSA